MALAQYPPIQSSCCFLAVERIPFNSACPHVYHLVVGRGEISLLLPSCITASNIDCGVQCFCFFEIFSESEGQEDSCCHGGSLLLEANNSSVPNTVERKTFVYTECVFT